ncbi:hypothetical protein EO087_09030 [Dyella sp. M7H15-1]|uniref:hypothetical protein n=1 Tax=Dyella sp. M7H15-1 TaxID=2501295 RepID=UPI001004D6C4|nr:hypothetical protein [Dyella sp. M7H15-1]QAU24115.1 hypothetical protein EO087_09030 [Dyella sp. M7H15-1]
MESTHPLIQSKACRCASIAGLIAIAMMPAISFADGAHVGQKAGPGDIVLIRNVAARPADRNPIAPGMALMVNASPNPQLNNSLNGGGGEMSDSEIADLTASVSARGASPGQSSMQRSLNAALGINTGGNSAGAANNGVSNVVGSPGPGGAAATITDNTRAIGDQVTSAVSQISLVGGH